MLQSFLDSIPLVRLLRRGSSRFSLSLAGVIVLAGLANAGLLAIINAAANSRGQVSDGRLFAAFGLTIGVYLYSQRSILFTTISEVERLLSDIRVRIGDRICRAELESIDQIGRSEIYGIVSRETQNISQAASTLVTALQSLVMVIFSIFYIAILSRTAFVITIGMIWLALVLHFRRAMELRGLLFEAQHRENELLGALAHLLDGFKEMRINRARSKDLFDHVRGISTGVETVKRRAGMAFSSHYVLTQAMLYALLAGIVFILPKLSTPSLDLVPRLTAAILFIIGPLGAIVGAIPLYSTANVAASNIMELEATLEASTSVEVNGHADAEPTAAFSGIEFKRAVFQYTERGAGGAFRLGPIDLQVASGETLFIVGGNGSGKSTLLKTLTGLYHPQSGSIVMDKTLVTPETVSWYRSHFTAVFSDYHLFDRLYGVRDAAPERVNELLALMRIENKTTFEGGRFTNLDLSSGQRKRLALIVALLENRPILVLDEWAADQDQVFRKMFYENILADLKKQGKTVIAATHDDRFFGVADRVVKMEYGEIVPYNGGA
jgi:putative ATP-binding cassette transporter